MGLQSMTGFASVSGRDEGVEWAWEVRSVNARGLEVRMRLPEGMEALEAKVRSSAAAALKRGSVNVALKLQWPEANGAAQLNADALSGMISAVKAACDAAEAAGLDLASVTAGELLGLRGVLDQGRRAETSAALVASVGDGLGPLFEGLREARAKEGAALAAVLKGQVTRIAELVAAARDSDTARMVKLGETLKARVAALLEETQIVDEARLAQELALLAVKADITEEMDRLEAHITSAHALLGAAGAVGRKLDFLMQEFNREANTLCSKSGDAALTAVGLELKVVIDQMREQVQNVE